MSQRVRCPITPLTEGLVALDAQATHYLLKVHRLRAGARFMAFDPSSRLEAQATLVSDHPRNASCRVDAPCPASLVASLPLTLLQGVGKGDKVEQVVRDATQVGVQTLVLVQTERSIPKLLAKQSEKLERYQRIALQAARQCGRGDMPVLAGPMPLTLALEHTQQLPLRLVFDAAGKPLSDAMGRSAPTGIAALIGPEGGLSEAELEQATQAGYERASLGPFTLRTETAAVAALAVLSELTRTRLPRAKP